MARGRLRRLVDYAVSFALKYYPLSVAWHEAMHHATGLMLGLKCYVALEFLFVLPGAGHLEILAWRPLTALELWWLYFSGGFLTALFLLLWRVFERDLEDRLAQMLLAGAQLGYAVAEGLMPFDQALAYALMGPLTLALSLALGLLELKLRGWRV